MKGKNLSFPPLQCAISSYAVQKRGTQSICVGRITEKIPDAKIDWYH